MPKYQLFPLPDAGEGLTEADLVTWRVAVGDRVEVNQPLIEIETAKSLVELPCPVDGVVTKLLAHEGDTVEVGVAICEFDIDPDGPPAPEEPEPAASVAPAEGANPAGPYAPAGVADAASVSAGSAGSAEAGQAGAASGAATASGTSAQAEGQTGGGTAV